MNDIDRRREWDEEESEKSQTVTGRCTQRQEKGRKKCVCFLDHATKGSCLSCRTRCKTLQQHDYCGATVVEGRKGLDAFTLAVLLSLF